MAKPGVRPYAPISNRYVFVGQIGDWGQALTAYYWDKLEEAYAMAQSLGTGPTGSQLNLFRMIEGEAITRQAAITQKPAPWLTLEYVTAEAPLDQTAVDLIVESCRSVAGKLGWNFEIPVWLTVLLAEVDAPWHGARFGYCVDKYPYDKICIPQRSTQRMDTLARVVCHEFTHVVTLNVTSGRIPHWLDEGLAMLMEGARLSPNANWMGPIELNARFERDRRDREGLQAAGEAYSQAAQLVRYLHKLGGDLKLARLLKAFVNNGIWAEVKINLLGEPSVEEALQGVYGLSQQELFARAQPG